MEIKPSLLGALVYLAMAAYLGAFVAGACRARKPGDRLFLAGFLVAVAAVAVRWQAVGHVPLQNLFDVFLAMGALVFPLGLFCRRFLRATGAAVDPLLGLLLLVPVSFILKADPQRLPPALQHWLFVPHVAAYVLADVILIKAAVVSLGTVFARGPDPAALARRELATWRMVRLGFPLLTAGLLLGASWGKLAWGDYWNWDPKELWSLATWLIYVAYFHFRHMYGRRRPRASAAIATAGALAVVLTLLWVNLAGRIFAGLHAYAR